MKIDEPIVSQIPALRSLWREAFSDTDEFLDIFERAAYSSKRCRCASVDGNVVAALYWFHCSYMGKPIAYIYAVATAHEFRGQGICHKLMVDTHSHLKELGYEGVVLVPGEPKLFQFYAEMGYEACCYIDEIRYTNTTNISGVDNTDNATSQTNNIRLEIIDKYEYAKQRLELLPEGGIIQEHENLDFLETQANFYMGNDFLLAARTEGHTLLGLELLGNKDVASGLVNKLGCTDGIFRTPGCEKPFAMYLPLSENAPSPSYFAFAFD